MGSALRQAALALLFHAPAGNYPRSDQTSRTGPMYERRKKSDSADMVDFYYYYQCNRTSCDERGGAL